jgi:serine/threonine protein kinase
MGLLKMLGLRKRDAEELLSVLDPQCHERLPYKKFLDFIFGPGAQSEESSTIAAAPTETSEQAADLMSTSATTDMPLTDTLKEVADLISTADTIPLTETLKDALLDTGSLSAKTASDGMSTALNQPETACAAEKKTPGPNQCSQCLVTGEVFRDPLDPTDLDLYCERCWIESYANSPTEAPDLTGLTDKLVVVLPTKIWRQRDLTEKWYEAPLKNWPPYASPTRAVKEAGPVSCPSGNPQDIPQKPGQSWIDLRVRVIPDLVGRHARDCTRSGRPCRREVIAGRYRIDATCGTGHFTRAFRATDLTNNTSVCIKRHNSLTIETLTDMMALAQRMEAVDPGGEFFPRLVDQFFDMSGYTVEALLDGSNCLELGLENPGFFQKMSNLRHVAKGGCKGLELLSVAGIVHCDLKPDNIMWTEAATPDGNPLVRIVDFGCARLDSRYEDGRNWSLKEGGAGHLGKWSPEMALRLPITAKADVWGLAVSLLELHCGRTMWSNDDDTVEVILAQALGLINARNGLPSDLLRRSPIDITRLYSPAPAHFPCQRISGGSKLEEMRPAVWGLGQVLGHNAHWDEAKSNLADFVTKAMEMDPEKRPDASTMLNHAFVAGEVAGEVKSQVESTPLSEFLIV